MSTLWQNIQYKVLRSDSKLNLLIGINVFVYLLINIPATIETVLFRSSSIAAFGDEYLRLTRLSAQVTFTLLDARYLHVHACRYISYPVQYAVALLVRTQIF